MTNKGLTNVVGTNLGVGETVDFLIGSERLFTNELQSNWTTPPASSSELETQVDCSNNLRAFLQG